MSCQILVGNQVGKKGEILLIENSIHIWTHNETLAAWRSKFPKKLLREYHRNFSLIKVSDKTKSELLYLCEPVIIDNNPVANRWFFVEPQQGSAQWQELFTLGETTKTFAEIEPFIREFS